jgi:hypothetical protein
MFRYRVSRRTEDGAKQLEDIANVPSPCAAAIQVAKGLGLDNGQVIDLKEDGPRFAFRIGGQVYVFEVAP